MNISKQNLVPLVILSTVIVGSGIAWRTAKSSSKTKEDSKDKKAASRIREAGKNVDTEDVKNRMQRSMELVKTTGVQLQEIYEKYGRGLIQQLQQIQQESKDIVDTAKEASEELQGTVQKDGKEALQEVRKTKDEAKEDLSQTKQNQSSSYSHNPHGPFGSN